MNKIARIAPVTDADAARLVHPDTLAALASQITATPVPEQVTSRRVRPTARRRLLVAGPVVAGLAVAALIGGVLASSGAKVGPVAVGPAAASALSFTSHGGYTTVIVRDPLADPARYRAEFARHHLRITLTLVPVSPSITGTVVEVSEPSQGPQLTTIDAKGSCRPASGGDACPVGVRIPADFRGQAAVTFGRAARPGEHYESTASAFAPGEALHGLQVTGKTVTRVLAMLSRRHVTAPLFNYSRKGVARNVAEVPGSWHVYDATPWAAGQVLLFVGPGARPAPVGPPQPGTPVASPSPASS